jgi:hypothetical protein
MKTTFNTILTKEQIIKLEVIKKAKKLANLKTLSKWKEMKLNRKLRQKNAV